MAFRTITYGLNVDSPEPIDSRIIKATEVERDAIPNGIRYEGLEVYITGTNTSYRLTGGITNSDWVDTGETFIPGDNAEAIKVAYESNDDTNAFTDDEQTDLGTALQPGDVHLQAIHVGDFVAPLSQAFVVGAFNLNTDHIQVNDINGDSFADDVVVGEKMRVALDDGTFAFFTILLLNTNFAGSTLVSFTGELPNNIMSGEAILVNQTIVTELDDTSTITIAVDEVGKTTFDVVTTLDADGNIVTIGGVSLVGSGGEQFADQDALQTFITDTAAFRTAIGSTTAYFQPVAADSPDMFAEIGEIVIASQPTIFGNAYQRIFIRGTFDETNLFTNVDRWMLVYDNRVVREGAALGASSLQDLPNGTLTLTSNTDGVFVFAVEGGAPITIDPADDDVSINSELTEITIGTSVFTKFALTDAQIASLVAADNAIPSNTLLPATGDITSIGGRTIAVESGDIIDNNDGEVLEIWTGTLEQYEALTTYSEQIIYNITNDFVEGVAVDGGANVVTAVVVATGGITQSFEAGVLTIQGEVTPLPPALLTSITLDDLAFTGDMQTANITVTGNVGTQFNLSIVNTTPLGWLTSGALGATSGTIPADGIFETTLSIPGSVLTVDRTAAIRAITSTDTDNIVTTGLFRQMHTAVVQDNDLTFSADSVIVGTTITFSVDITSGDPPFTLELFDTDPSVGVQIPIETQTQTVVGNYPFASIDSTTLGFGDISYFIRVTDTDGDTATIEETITIIDPGTLLFALPTVFYPRADGRNIFVFVEPQPIQEQGTRTLIITSDIAGRVGNLNGFNFGTGGRDWVFISDRIVGTAIDQSLGQSETFSWVYRTTASPPVEIASGTGTQFFAVQPEDVPFDDIHIYPPRYLFIGGRGNVIGFSTNALVGASSMILEWEAGDLTEFTNPTSMEVPGLALSSENGGFRDGDINLNLFNPEPFGVITFRFTLTEEFGTRTVSSVMRTITIPT